MITIPVEDWVFAVAALVGGVLLLITVVFDDILGGLLDGFGFDIGGTSFTPILLGFVGMFGAGGLFATQVLDVHGAQAAIIGVVSGDRRAPSSRGRCSGSCAGPRARSRSRSPTWSAGPPTSPSRVPAGRYGSVLVKAEGQTHEFAATADADIPAGRTVEVIGVAGTGLIVRDTATPAGGAGTAEG